MNALHALLNGVVDYAGLFPPAALSMTEAVQNYARYLQDDSRWALARFVVPVARLQEFFDSFYALPSDSRNQIWLLSALAGNDVESDLKRIDEFNARFSCDALIDAIELKAASVDEILRLSVPKSLATYVEIPIAQNPEALIEALARKGFRAKARTGGVSAEAFPSPEQLARFIFLCAKRQTPFKATAGLHHPIRASYRLTYEPDSPSGTMFGFLNVLLAAVFALEGMSEADLAALLSETSPEAFHFDDGTARWRSFVAQTDAIERARAQFAISFGSCSFEEPIADLKNLQLLER
ncbi:MAG: hypothetical protein NZM06_04205 [Chloroherpetonaceae bacterium]|nr:hypothetical protein [Chloroherpetonaceae bacterium]MDW8436803.1 hypothetical protein [Chloroherpetonaceae bacterium]